MAAKGVLPRKARHVDVILDQHDVSHVKSGVQPSSCIRDNQSFHAQQEEDSHRVRHLNRDRHDALQRAGLSDVQIKVSLT